MSILVHLCSIAVILEVPPVPVFLTIPVSCTAAAQSPRRPMTDSDASCPLTHCLPFCWLQSILGQVAKNRGEVMFGSHNQDSIQRVVNNMAQLGLKPSAGRRRRDESRGATATVHCHDGEAELCLFIAMKASMVNRAMAYHAALQCSLSCCTAGLACCAEPVLSQATI